MPRAGRKEVTLNEFSHSANPVAYARLHLAKSEDEGVGRARRLGDGGNKDTEGRTGRYAQSTRFLLYNIPRGVSLRHALAVAALPR